RVRDALQLTRVCVLRAALRRSRARRSTHPDADADGGRPVDGVLDVAPVGPGLHGPRHRALVAACLDLQRALAAASVRRLLGLLPSRLTHVGAERAADPGNAL